MGDESYSTANYGMMMCDRGRIDPYLAALRKVIVPGESVVLELGTGTGVVAFAAMQAGAKKVYAVEPNSAIEVAREIAKLNGVEGIEFVQEMSTNIELPPADVLISDMRGVLPFHEMHLPSIMDARTRLLKPGGAQIASSDTLYMAPVEHEKAWRSTVGYWDENPVGLDMSPAKRVTSNALTHCDCKPEDLLAPPSAFVTVDYRTVESPHLSAELSFNVSRNATMHGLSLWFETALDDEISLSTAPGQPLLAYGRLLLPLHDPFEVCAGERLAVSISARLVRDQYIWTWAGRVDGDPSRRFEQSSFLSSDVSLSSLGRVRLDAKPARSAEAERMRFVFERLDGEHSVEALADELRTQSPELDRDSSIAVVSDLVARFGRSA